MRKRRPSVTTVIACLALFFALGGTAIAARQYLITSTDQIKPSVLEKLKGKEGPPGPDGPQGPVGPAGPAGAAGSVGETGSVGPRGLTGETGPVGPRGLTGETGPVGPAGPAGRNGEEGPPGKDGSGSVTLSSLKEVTGAEERVPAYNELGPGGEEGAEASVATCPSGEHAISGGTDVFPGAVAAMLSVRSRDGGSWIVAVFNASTFKEGFVQAIAYCAASGEAVAASAPGRAHASAVAEAKQLMTRLRARARSARAKGWK